MAKMRLAFSVAAIILSASISVAQISEPDGGGIRRGNLPLAWNTGGPKCMEMPEFAGARVQP